MNEHRRVLDRGLRSRPTDKARKPIPITSPDQEPKAEFDSSDQSQESKPKFFTLSDGLIINASRIDFIKDDLDQQGNPTGEKVAYFSGEEILLNANEVMTILRALS